jgi:hypothetical protein
MRYLCDIYREVARILSAEDLEILLMYVMDIKSYAEIGGYLRNEVITDDNRVKLKMAAKRRIVKIKDSLGYGVTAHLYIIWEQFLLDNPSMEEATVPQIHIGWLWKALMRVNDGGYWGLKDGYKVYKSKSTCEIPQYLQGAFGDNKTHCTLCGTQRCTRKKDNGTLHS